MNKRPYTKHHSLFFIIPLLIVIFFVFALLPQASPTAAEQPGSGVCVRFSLNQGRNAASGAGVNGRYEMREVTTGVILALWNTNSQETISNWLTDLPQVSDGGSWVNVDFYPAGEETAVPLQILNPAPNTPYGWVANGQCHAVELQFPSDWAANSSNTGETDDSSGVGGGNFTETGAEQENSNTESVEEATGFRQDWIPNLGSLRPISDVQVTGVNAPLTVGRMGAWQDEGEGKIAYGFTLMNTSANHYITNVEYLVSFTGADGNLVNERTIQSVRDFYPLEAINLGESYFADSETAYDSVEISLISAEAVPISDTPLALEWRPSSDANFSETGIWLLQEQGEEGESAEDTNEVQFNFDLRNPNATFVATNSTFSINILDDAGNILGRGQGDIGDIQPLQSWELKGSIFVESPELIAETEIIIEPEAFTPIDPATLPTRLIQEDQISFTNQNVNITFSGQIDFEFHLTEMITDGGFGSIVAIAYDANSNAIGGGAHELFGAQLVSTAQSIFMPIHASTTPATVELYVTYDFIDEGPPRGGGGSHPGRDI